MNLKMKCIYIISFVISCFAERVTDTNQNILRKSPCDNHQHLFLTPGVLAGGSSNRACISRLGDSVIGTAHFVLALESNGITIVRASRDLSPGNGGCIDIVLPKLNRTEADLHVTMSYPISRCIWERRLTVRILGSRVMYVQTERPRYRPGDLVRLRVLQLRTDLTPSNASIESLWLESPGGVRVMTWSSIRTRLGLSQVQYTLDDRATSGVWKAHVRADDGSMGSAGFSVGEYEPPPFQLSVRYSPRVLRTNDRLMWTVCIRYPWGEAVEGMLVIRLRGAGGGVRTALRVRAPRACHRHAVAARRVGLNGSQRPDVIVADFSFQEGGTMVWQNTTVISQVVNQPITLDFMRKHRSAIVPSLPHKLKVKAIRWDDHPAVNVTINICRHSTNFLIPINIEVNHTTEPKLCHRVATDANGIAQFSFTASEKETFQYLRFKASLHNDSSVSTETTLSVVRNRVSHAAFGSLVQDALLPAARAPVPLYVNLPSNSYPITVHFAVITRGGVIYRWGTITQCATPANSKQQTYGGRCYNEAVQNQNLNQSAHGFSERTENILRVMLPIRLSSQMCPDSDLVAYFYYGGELISANKHFEVDECFVNKVETKWSSRQVLPGSPVSLHITTPGPALCAVSAIDFNNGATLKTKDTLVENLKRILGANRNLTAHDTLAECFSAVDSELDSPSTWLGAETQAAFAESGVRVVTDLLPNRLPCAPATLVDKDEKNEPRSYFPEAWLWRVMPVNENGSAEILSRAPEAISRYEANVYCIARNGLGVAAPNVLQVFREFFIHTDAPKHLKRGDISFLQYRLFNYIYNQLPVQIKITSDPGVQIFGESSSKACLNARSSVSHRVEIRANVVGTWRIRVTARTVDDKSLCVNATYDATNENTYDEVVLQISVTHEGIPTEEHRSSLLCADNNDTPKNMSVKWSDIPAVPGTDMWKVTAYAELIGPLLTNADSLISLPRGCGEQNMARLATNILALEQLNAGSTETAVVKDNVARGFARQLQFAHPTGGFSAFGVNDGTPSTWLTAFTLRYLLRAHKILMHTTPVPAAVSSAKAWLLSQQMENGCFRNEGQVFHRELKGGLNEDGELANVGLTAYVITSLLEGDVALSSRTLRDSLSCLRALPLLTKTNTKTKNVHVYSQVLVSYALMRLRKYEDDLIATNDVDYMKHGGKLGPGLKADEEIKELVGLFKLALRENNLVWWDTGSLPTSIEATGYALLALSSCPKGLYENCASDARAAAAWLANHKSSNGGFISTQDTLVALEGMSAWFRRELWPRGRLLVTASSQASEKAGEVTGNVPLTLNIPPGNVLDVNVQGTGCALVQASRSYNSLLPEIDPTPKTLNVQVSVQTEGPFDCASDDMCFCAAIVTACAVWSNAFPAMALLEVWLPTTYRADASKLYAQLEQKDTLLRRIETRAHNGRVIFYLGTKDGRSTARVGHECFTLHAVGPKRRTGPAHARVIDYYKPDVNDTQTYTISEDCPARISHDNRSEFTNNLYGRALIDEDDNETFEDLPDDIPLDSPVRENITIISDGIKHEKQGKSIKTPNFEKPQHTDHIVLEKPNEIPHQKTDNETIEITFDDDKVTKIENKHKEKIRDIGGVQNDGSNDDSNTDPHWNNFHVINSETDLEVPPGIEGPVPAVVLPPRRNGDANNKVITNGPIPKKMIQRYTAFDHYVNYPVFHIPAY